MEGKIFFNYATVGPISKTAYKAVGKFLKAYSKIGPPEVLEVYDEYNSKLQEEVGKLLNCSPNEIVPVKNTTEGIFIASEALPLSKNDEILLLECEYPANLLPWLKKKKDGITVRAVGGKNSEDAFENLISSISEKTKLIAISWGQFYDGFLPDMHRLSKICVQKKIFLVVDGAHCVATRQIDLQEVHVDILSCPGQKHIGALPGIGFMYINKKTLPFMRDFKVGTRSVKSFDSESYTLKDGSDRFLDGTQNLIGIVSLYAAISEINAIGMENIEKVNIGLLNSFKKTLKDKKIPFINFKDQVSIISMKVANPKGLADFLRSRKIYIKHVRDVARISFSHQSQLSEFNALADNVLEWISSQNQAKESRACLAATKLGIPEDIS